MNCGAIIFSRYDSRRLPGKVLLDIAGLPLLGHVLARSRQIDGHSQIIIATTERGVDDPIVEYAQAQGISVFRGAVDDVAGRALACARSFNLDSFVRICGDRPFFGPETVSRLIQKQNDSNYDLATNALEKTYPPGLTAEVVSVDALKRAMALTNNADDREHVTQYFYNHRNDFTIFNLKASDDSLLGCRLVVDTPEDLERARWIATRLAEGVTTADERDVVELAKHWDSHVR